MDQENVKLLLSYFVVLGLIQFTESLIPGVLEKRIRESLTPFLSSVVDLVAQYWTVKLAFLAYLIHPQTKVCSFKSPFSYLTDYLGRFEDPPIRPTRLCPKFLHQEPAPDPSPDPHHRFFIRLQPCRSRSEPCSGRIYCRSGLLGDDRRM